MKSLALPRRRGFVNLMHWSLAAAAVMLGGCASVEPGHQRTPSLSITDTDSTTLGQAFARDAAVRNGQSGFKVVATGHEALVARAALADLAERTLDLQYYSVGDDSSSALLLSRLLAAAERGVRVRVLLDDLFATARKFGARARAAHSNIEVRLFNPFRAIGSSGLVRLSEFAFDAERLNVRMHNKAWIADSAAAVFGSRNVGDEYFDLSESEGFTDIDLLVIGPAVGAMSEAFNRYWNSDRALPVERFAPTPGPAMRERVQSELRALDSDCQANGPCRWLAESELREALGAGRLPLAWAPARFFADAPEGEKKRISSGVEHGYIGDDPAGAQTVSELLIVSPYFIPDAHGIAHLTEMSRRGVRVSALTNSLASTDSIAAHAGYAGRRSELLRAGIQLHEFKPQNGLKHRPLHRWGQASPASLHTKLVVQDRARVVVGSLNQDPRSRLHNTESWLMIESRELAAELADHFEEGIDLHHSFRVEYGSNAAGGDSLSWLSSEQGLIVRHDSEPMTGVWLLLWRATLRWLVPEHLL